VWCEEVRINYFKAIGEPAFTPDRPGPVIKDIGFEYVRALAPDDRVLVAGRITWIRRSSFRMEYAAWKDGLIGRGHATCVWYINNLKTVVPLSDDLRRRIVSLDKPEDRAAS
jgi:acyl-CoA thioester hydrolase